MQSGASAGERTKGTDMAAFDSKPRFGMSAFRQCADLGLKAQTWPLRGSQATFVRGKVSVSANAR